MAVDSKDLWILNRFNGVDINQSKNYIKSSNETYINKLLEEHDWPIDAVVLPTYEKGYGIRAN